MLEPAASQRAGYAVLAAGFAICRPAGRGRGCPAARAPRPPCSSRSPRSGSRCSAGGAADEQLLPTRWGELAAEIGRGLSTLPGRARPVPRTRRVDAAGDRTRRHRAGGRRGAAGVLAAPARARASATSRSCCWSTLYVVPAVALDLSSEFLSGALLALLVVAYLRLERLQITDAGHGRVPRASRSRSSGSPRRPRWTPTSRGSTTRRGRSPTPPRSRRASPGTTPTARSTGRATGASCCA